jgi:hypothetical protein
MMRGRELLMRFGVCRYKVAPNVFGITVGKAARWYVLFLFTLSTTTGTTTNTTTTTTTKTTTVVQTTRTKC